MLDEVAAQRWFNQIHELWVQPELDRRFAGNIPEGFQIRCCLIRLPSNGAPIVEFNDEVGWLTKPILALDVKLEVGRPVYLHEIIDIGTVLPPVVDGNRVAFVFLFWGGFTYHCFFDFRPNWPDFDASKYESEFDGIAVQTYLRSLFIEHAVALTRNNERELQKIGLWTSTALLPYPISKIIERITLGEINEAREILVDYCNNEFIAEKLVRTWQYINVFKTRQQVFDDAFLLHSKGRYEGSVNILIGQIEGVITDWLHEILPPSHVNRSIKSKIKQFRSLILEVPQLEYSYRQALESTSEFLANSRSAATPYQPFVNWLDKVDPNFPARHAISHGKYIPELYTEENSIKVFLLLDSICQFMMFYETRVLRKDLTNPSEDSHS